MVKSKAWLIPFMTMSASFAFAGPLRHYEVYEPAIERGYVVESSRDGLAYNHCPTVVWFQDRWVAAWNANPRPGESSSGHEIYLSTSRDGRTWSAPYAPFSDPAHSEPARRYPQARQWQPVFIVVEDELWCLFQQNSPNAEERGTMFARLADPDGRWSIRRLDLGGRGDRVRLQEKDWSVFPSQNPIRLRSGRVLVPSVLRSGRAPDAPETMQGWWANEKRASVLYTDDLGETWQVSPGCSPGGRSWAPWEPTVWEQSDGSVQMVFRHNAHPAQVETMPASSEFLYSAMSRDGGETWTSPAFVPIETACSRMYVAPPDGAGIWNPVTPAEDFSGRLHLMLHHDFPGGQGWEQDRRNLALFFRRGDGVAFTAGPSFSALEPRAVYPHYAAHGNSLLVLYTQSHLEKRSIRYAHITPRPDPEKRYLLPRADIMPSRKPEHDGRLLRFESLAEQYVTARNPSAVTGGRFTLSAWIRPDSRGLIWDTRSSPDERSGGGLVWGLAGLGGTGERDALPVLFLQWPGARLVSRLPIPQGAWAYVGVEMDVSAKKVRFVVNEQMEEHDLSDMPPPSSLSGGPAVIGAASTPQSGGPAFHGDFRYLALFDQSLGQAGHRAIHDRFASECGRERLGSESPSLPVPAFEMDPASPGDLAQNVVFPDDGFQGVRRDRRRGRDVLRFTGEGSAGVDLDENYRLRGDEVQLRFRVFPESGDRLVFCTVGDAEEPARVEWLNGDVFLVAGDQRKRAGKAARGQWADLEVKSFGRHTRVSVNGGDPVIIRHVPQGTWVYLGQGYRTGAGSEVDAFLVDVASVTSRVIPAPDPLRALYNNDFGNLYSAAPFSIDRSAGVEERLNAAVDETVGLGAHLFAPGWGWVPLWQSETYPPAEHFRWWQEQGGQIERPWPYPRYLIDGGDLVSVFVERCREKGVPPFITLRMNDYHYNELLWLPDEPRREEFGRGNSAYISLSRFLLENHEAGRIGPDNEAFVEAVRAGEAVEFIRDGRRRWPLRDRGVLDWARPEVRAHRLAFIRELAAYDLVGLEMDFMRHSRYFKDDFPIEDRIAIMTDFVRKARQALDENAPDGSRRMLGARVPLRLAQMPPLGIDLEAFVEAGLDFINLSQHFMSTPDSDLAEVVRMLPGTPVYLEMTQASSRRDGVWRLVTPEQLATAAHVTYARGGAGLSYFNIQYHRQGQDDVSRAGVRNDVPFDVMRRIADPAEAAAMPQHYFIGPGNNQARVEGARQLPCTLDRDRPAVVSIDAVPPAEGWQTAGRLRVETREPWDKRLVTLTVNGVPCDPMDETGEPFPGPYFNAAAEADPGQLRAWTVPPELLMDGENEIRLVLEEGDAVRLEFVDLAFPES